MIVKDRMMSGTISRMCIAGAMLATSLLPAAVFAAPADRWECDQVAAYQGEIWRAFPDGTEGEVLLEFMQDEEKDFASIPSRDLLLIADGFESWADEMEEIDPPKVAEDHLEGAVDGLVMISNLIRALAVSGPLGAIAYTGPMEEHALEMELIMDQAALRCGDTWTDAFPDGESTLPASTEESL